jgi:hypothetical protein
VIFDDEADVVGADFLGAYDTLIPPVAGESVFVTIETMSTVLPEGDEVYLLHVLDGAGGMVLETRPVALPAGPERLVVLDGRILITAGSSTVVLTAEDRR